MIEPNQTWVLNADLSKELRKAHMPQVQVLAVSATGETITVFGLSATRALVRAIERARFLLLYRLSARTGEPSPSAAPSLRGRAGSRTRAYLTSRRPSLRAIAEKTN
jgi:hypothetical protein